MLLLQVKVGVAYINFNPGLAVADLTMGRKGAFARPQILPGPPKQCVD